MPVGWAIVVVVQWLAIVALLIVVLGVLRQITPHLQRGAAPPMRDLLNQGPAVGSKLPAFAARDAGGDVVLGKPLNGQPGVLLFLSASCRPCLRMARELGDAEAVAGLAGSLVVVCDPEGAGVLAFPPWLRVLTMSEAEGSEMLGIALRPFAIAVDAGGVVTAKRMLNTIPALTDLVRTVLPAPVPAEPGG